MPVASASLPAARGTPWRVWWLYLLVLSLPFFGFSFFNLGDRGLLRADWVFAVLLVLAFALRVLAGAKVRVGVTGVFVVALHIAALLSALNLFNASNAQVVDFLTTYFQLVLMSLLFFAMSNMKVTDGQLRNVIRVWLLIAALVGSYAIYEVIAVNLGLPMLPIRFTNPSYVAIGTGPAILANRAASFLTEPGYLGSILTAPLVILTFLLAYGRSREVLFRSVWMNRATWVVLAIAAIAAQSIATYIVLLAVGLLLLGRFWRRPRGLGRLAFAGGTLFLVVMLAAFLTKGSQYEITDRLAKRFNNIMQGRDGSMQARAARAQVAIQVWGDHPLIGVGLNNYVHAAAIVGPPEWYRGAEPVTIGAGGNRWIGSLAEMGVVGFLAAAGVWLSMLRRLGRAARLAMPADYLSVILIALFYVLLADLAGSLFAHSLVQMQIWFDLGLASLWLAHWRASAVGGQSARPPVRAGPQ